MANNNNDTKIQHVGEALDLDGASLIQYKDQDFNALEYNRGDPTLATIIKEVTNWQELHRVDRKEPR